MTLTDTHTHLFSKEFGPDRTEVIENAISKGVSRLFIPNVDVSTIEECLNLGKKYSDNCFPMLGLHPCHVFKDYRSELKKVEHYLSNNKVYGIGECGLDYYHDKSYITEQKEALKIQINWAIELNLPIILHTRDSFQDTIDLIKLYKGKVKGIFHCFTGSVSDAQQVIDIGFYMGVGGVVTFKNSGLDKTLINIDIQHIVLETDSPYLAPTPLRGKRNESSYLVNIAQKVAEIYNLSLEEVAAITTKNSIALFDI